MAIAHPSPTGPPPSDLAAPFPGYQSYGAETPDRPSLVLLHAFPLDRRMWHPVAERLQADGYHLILIDAPGLGDSASTLRELADRPGAVPDLAFAADQVAALIDRLGLERVVVAGLSMGGYTALAFARRHRDRLAALALLDTKATADDDAARANRERLARAVLGEAGVRALTPMLETLIGPTTIAERPEVMAQLRALLEAASPIGVAWSQRAMAARPDSRSVLAELADSGLRSVVIVGDEDVLTPVGDAQLMALQLRCPLVVVAGSGHLSPLEDPPVVAAALATLMREITTPR
jgi:pimeloyl-ACP methyl ester carboxylesterase